MKTSTCPISTCRACRFYAPEGRRGGQCQQLGAPVSGRWKACSLAFPPFAPSWETIEGAVGWSPVASHLEAVMALECTEDVEPLPVKATRY